MKLNFFKTPKQQETTCKRCKGSGQVLATYSRESRYDICPKCNGTGTEIRKVELV